VPVKVTETDPARNEIKHMCPQFLPDGRHFLYLIKGAKPNTNGIYISSLDHPQERWRLLASNYKGIYTVSPDSHSGWLLCLRQQMLMAQPFDAAGLRLTGEPVAIADHVAVDRRDEAAFWASDAGILVYHTGTINSALSWVSREGKILEKLEPGGRYDALALSPDGKRVALCRSDADNNSDIWIYEFGRKVMTRLTFDSAPLDSPVWSPDGRQLAFSSSRSGSFQIYRKNVDGSGQEEQLTEGPGENYPDDWSRDGKYLLYQHKVPQKSFEVWLLPLEGGRKPVPLLQAPFDEELATFSPDGKWIAYMSTESAPPWNVYVRAFSGPSLGPGGKVQISTDGGWPHWRGDGKEIFYHRFTDHPELMAARIRVGNGGIQSESPVELFPFGGNASVTAHTWDVTADGQRLLISELVGLSSVANRLNVVVNWQARLSR
jgi:dipeptidyl aminopeptidase/acylaminoacyl peptidase